MPNVPNVQTASPLYLDGSPIDAYQDALSTAKISVQAAGTADRLWSSPPRLISDPHRDIFEVGLNNPHPVNSISFDLAHFPHTCYVEYFEPATQGWQPCLTTAGAPTIIVTTDSIPGKIMPYSPGRVNPFHVGAGHWLSQNLRIQTVVASRFRLVLVRTQGSPPIDSANQPKAYPLGVRNYEVGYKVREKGDLPYSLPSETIATEREAFSYTTDLLGSAVSFNVRENKAFDLLNGSQWKCEPQPVPYGVVSLYADVRRRDGSPSILDRFFIDPLYSGCHVNLYYSNDTPSGDYAPSDNPLTYPESLLAGSTIPLKTPTGLLFGNDFSYVEVDNRFVQFDVMKAFWLGFQFAPQFDSTEVARHVLFATTSFTIYYENGTLNLAHGSTITSMPTTFAAGRTISLVVGLDTVGVMMYLVDDNGMSVTGDTEDSQVFEQPRIMRLGTDMDALYQANFELRAFVLKQDALTDEVANDYLADPSAYGVESAVDATRTQNALLRFSPTLLTTGNGVNPTGLIGGPLRVYDDLTWTPVSRDYKLRRGFYYLPRVSARFWKFEFSNLSPRPYASYKPMRRKVKVWTTETIRRFRALQETNNYSQPAGGAKANEALSGVLRFSDHPSGAPSLNRSADFTATEVYHSTDPILADRMRDRGSIYGFQQWHPGWMMPRFVDVTRHVYEEVDVIHSTKVAYFVGLKSIKAYRVDYAMDDDTDQYLEEFADLKHIESSTWFIDGALYTDETNAADTAAVTTSTTYGSTRKVRGLQFASQQTPALQLLPDPDFSIVDATGTTDLSHWTHIGDATMEPSSVFNSDVGSTVHIQRHGQWHDDSYYENYVDQSHTQTNQWTWGGLQQQWPSWRQIYAILPGATWQDMETYDVTIADPPILVTTLRPYVPGGLRSSDFITPTLAGRIYAAGRIIAPRALKAPLYLQIISQSGADLAGALAEIEIPAAPGAISEATIGYTIGNGGLFDPQTWQQIMNRTDLADTPPTYNDLSSFTWGNLSNAVVPLTDSLGVRIVQKVETDDEWYVDNISIFEDAIVWEFSNDGGSNWWPVYDIRNNPNGIFVFPDLGQTGTSLKWRVRGFRPGLHIASVAIRPWYDDLITSIPSREAIQSSGPNIAMADQYAPVAQDPRFKMWNRAIPQEWWYAYRQAVQAGSTPVATDGQGDGTYGSGLYGAGNYGG